MKITLTPLLLAVLLLAGCSTTVTYQSRSAAGPAKPVNYPICVYAQEQPVPRACEAVGMAQATGKSLEAVMGEFMRTARTNGADAVQIVSVESPDFLHNQFRVEAGILRFTDVWERCPLSEAAVKNYLNTNLARLDPIEGIWAVGDAAGSRVGIVKNNSKGGRDFMGFVLETKNTSWQTGYKKLEIARGFRAGVYMLTYYQDDFEAREAATVLDQPGRGMFYLQGPGVEPINFTRE